MTSFLARLFDRVPADRADAALYFHDRKGVALPSWVSRMVVSDFGLGAQAFSMDPDQVGTACLTALEKNRKGKPPRSHFTHAHYAHFPKDMRAALGLGDSATLWARLDHISVQRSDDSLILKPWRHEGRGGYGPSGLPTVAVEASCGAAELGQALLEMRAMIACG